VRAKNCLSASKSKSETHFRRQFNIDLISFDLKRTKILIDKMMAGGLAELRGADDEIQAIVDKIRSDLEGKSGKSFSEFKAVSYRSQVVAGTNFFIKIKTGDDFTHVRVFRPLACYGDELELVAHKLGCSEGDAIDHFDWTAMQLCGNSYSEITFRPNVLLFFTFFKNT